MKIAMIGHKRIPGREGGVEVVVEELSTRLAEKGHSVVAYNRNDFKHETPKEYKGVKLVNIWTIPHKTLEAVVYSFFATIHAIFSKFDVIHYHAIGPAVMLIIPHLLGIKTVVTVHGLNYKTPKWKGFASWYIKQGEIITAKYADEIIVLSKDCQDYFLNTYNRETQYVPNGVSLREIKEAKEIKKKFNLEKDKYILFLSRVVPGKGLEYLLDAFREIDTDLKLVIAGESVQANEFFEMILEKSRLDNRVLFTGFVQGNTFEELFSNAKLFVFPSEAEGMAISLLEAMSFNCNCVASDIPENIEVGQDHIKYFESTNVQSLKKALEEQLNSSVKYVTRPYVEENYNWDSVCTKTEEIFNKVKKVASSKKLRKRLD